MEFQSIEERDKMLYETLKYIDMVLTRLLERTVQVRSADDFRLSPWGMEKLDAACMILIAVGESVKTLDKLTNKQLLPTYPSIDWKGVMGMRDVIAHHYFDVDADAVFSIIKEDIPPLKAAIDFFIKNLFPNDNTTNIASNE
jgi:uncharacterized protein with HEPN domain